MNERGVGNGTVSRTVSATFACLGILAIARLVGAEPIVCGQTLERAFDAPGQSRGFTFAAKTGEVVSITTDRGPDSTFYFEATWQLIDKNGVQVPRSDNSTARCNRTCQSAPLPVDGTYTILVADDPAIGGYGPYSVTLDAVSKTLDGVATCAGDDEGPRPIACGQSHSRSITPEGDTDAFTFDASAGEVVSIAIGRQAVGGTFYFAPTWKLFSADGALVDHGGSSPGCLGVCQTAPLPATDTYTVLVYDDPFESDTGPYTISLDPVSATFGGNANEPPVPACMLGSDGTQPIYCNQTLNRAIGAFGETDSFTFAVATPTPVSISIGPAAGSTFYFNPAWKLFDGTGQQVPRSDDSLAGCTGQCLAKGSIAPGPYTILVQDLDGSLAGSGPYSLSLVFLGECGGPPDTCGNGTLEADEQCDLGATNGADDTCCTSGCQFQATSHICRPATDLCDAAETCSGSNAACPVDALASSGTVCRPAGGTCDVAEVCSGGSASCPLDVVKSTGTACRSAAGACDVAEVCDGANPGCPSDGFEPSSTPCRASAGVCDAAESCSGSSATCPPDAKVPSGTVCRPSIGACDAAETCSGSSATCPADVLASSSTVCRPAAEACDVAETCAGSSATCPADTLRSAGTVCRAAAGACDVAETCTGGSATCPADVTAPNGTSCDDGLFCTVADQCAGGLCGGTPRVCNDGDACTTDQCDEALDQCTASASSCDDGNACTADSCGAGNSCIHAPRPGDACDDGNSCTVGNLCQADGTCSPGTAKSCATLDDQCSRGVCDSRTGDCIKQPQNDPACAEPCVLLPDGTVCPGCALTCGVGSCVSGIKQCELTIVIPAKKRRPIVVIVIVLGSSGDRCQGTLRELPTAASLNSGRVDLAEDTASGRVLGKARARRIGSDGRTELKLKLNPVARQLLKNRGEIQTEAQVTVGKGSSKQLLTQLIHLVRKN